MKLVQKTQSAPVQSGGLVQVFIPSGTSDRGRMEPVFPIKATTDAAGAINSALKDSARVPDLWSAFASLYYNGLTAGTIIPPSGYTDDAEGLRLSKKAGARAIRDYFKSQGVDLPSKASRTPLESSLRSYLSTVVAALVSGTPVVVTVADKPHILPRRAVAVATVRTTDERLNKACAAMARALGEAGAATGDDSTRVAAGLLHAVTQMADGKAPVPSLDFLGRFAESLGNLTLGANGDGEADGGDGE